MARGSDLQKQYAAFGVEYALVVLAMWLPIVWTNHEVLDSPRFFRAFDTAALIALPLCFIKPRWRAASLVPVWLINIFFLTNLWYYRFFREFIPLQNYLLWSNFNGDLFRAGASMVQWVDFIMTVPAIVLTVLYCAGVFGKYAPVTLPRRWKVAVSVLVAGCFVVDECIAMWREPLPEDIKHNKILMRLNRYNPRVAQLSPYYDYVQLDLLPYLWINSMRYLTRRRADRTLDELEASQINRYIDLHSSLSAHTPDLSDCFASNRHKNLVFIVVESLNAPAVNYEYEGRKIMPVLSALVAAEGTVSTLELVPQTHSGNSSDGQFIYNTGLYAASDATTVQEYMDRDFQSLPRILSEHHSFEVISESPDIWNHRKSNEAYGYGDFIFNTELRALRDGRGLDETMFDTALEVIDTIPKPFFGMLITMSMHSPFDDEFARYPAWIDTMQGVSEKMKHYLGMCSYFDKCLGRFIQSLKDRGLYESTLIVIASDHSVGVPGSDMNIEDTPIVFAAAGTGKSFHSHARVGQVDVFPTLLQIMNRYDPRGYTGMGLSIFNPRLKGAVDRRGNIIGDTVSGELSEMLRLAPATSNLMLRKDHCQMHKTASSPSTHPE